LFAFILGSIVGSFLNCIIYRIETKQSFLKGRSFCPVCKHKLNFFDLIPIVSFLFLKGKCRYCKAKISWQYPLVEIGTGLIFLSVIIYHLSLINYQLLLITDQLSIIIYQLLISCFLIIVFVYDLKHSIIPDKVIFPAIAIALTFSVYTSIANASLLLISDSILSAFIATGFFLSIVLISKGKWMGIGDIKLAFLMGLFLGFPNILIALFLSFLIGAIIGVGLILAKSKNFKSEIPFGPFLVTGTFVALFWGEKIINWYLNILTY
ncbi:MAG: prepilin peptidase, partial [Patescibacteria group bacterium]|nr:prepilin peptidase [Patescibacteria group bacterium]